MSIKIMTAIWEREDLGTTAKFILISLADHANDDGVCYPSISRLAKRTSLTDRAVRLHLNRLQDDGWLRIDRNAGPRGCNVFTLCTPERRSSLNDVHPERNASLPLNDVPPPPERRSPEPSLEPSGTVNRTSKREDPHFAEFWNAYPRKVAKGAARKAWAKAVKGADPPTIIEAARRVEDRGEYTPHPATWLNAERWTDQESNHERHNTSSRPGSGQAMLDAASRAIERRRASRGDTSDAGGDAPGVGGMDCRPGRGASVAFLEGGRSGAYGRGDHL